MTNFKMTDAFTFPKTKAEKVEANMQAIRLVKKLQETGETAFAEEQAILARYVGWGGLANDFFDSRSSRFEAERNELKALVTKEEYHAMEQSSLTAYYTDPAIAREMWEHLLEDGFKGGNILDPSMGTGIFFATMPEKIMSNSTLYGIELDTITGAIAKQLFPEATIKIQGFETVDFKDSPFDLVITNVPFGDFRIRDNENGKVYLIHDYFISKATRLVRDKGVVAVITSTGTVDKRTGSVLRELDANNIAFLGGVRLPNNAFRAIAGTTVTSDILFFQKNGLESNDELYFGLTKSDLDEEGRVFVNTYFRKEEGEENEQVLGNYTIRYFNGATLSLAPYADSDLMEDLNEALKNLCFAEGFAKATSNDVEVVELVGEEDIELIERLNIRLHEYACDANNNIYYRDTEGVRPSSRSAEMVFYQNKDGVFSHYDKKYSEKVISEFEKARDKDDSIVTSTYISPTPSTKGANKGLYKGVYFYEKALEKTENARILGMIKIKNAYQDVIDIQATSDYDKDEFQTRLARLNTIYDHFVATYGFINLAANARLFERDDRYPLIASLEEEELDENDSSKIVYIKSEAFKKALVRPKKELKIVDSAYEALMTSLSEGRGVDFDLMMSVYPNSTKDSLVEELGTLIMIDVEWYQQSNVIAYEIKDTALAGDVRTKRDIAQSLLEKGDNAADWEWYVEQFEQVIPEDVLITDISFNLGSAWIPNRVVGYFAWKVLGDSHDMTFEDEACDNVITTTKIGRGIKQKFVNRIMNRQGNIKFGLRENSKYGRGHDILTYLLGSDQPTITKNIGTTEEPKRVVDEVATANLREAERKLQEAFKSFVEEDDELVKVVEAAYNDTFNRRVNRQYDGSHLKIDGLIKGAELRPHQLNAVQRIIEDKRALLAHEVGSGKSLTMTSAAFKMKDLGLINKPIFVVPSSLTAQFGQEIMRFFPTRKVFVTTEQDFEKSRRRLFISRIITGDYDGIVIGHSQFQKIKVSQERQVQFLNDKIAEMQNVLDYAEENDDRISYKQAKALERNYEAQLMKVRDSSQSRTDDFIDFESLGVDMLFVDEAHKYKNVRPLTRLGNVAGIGNTTAQQNIDMEMKIRSIQEEHNNTNVVFATGTPVSNSISEMYTMMNYIQPDVLEDFGMDNFDAWVGAFGIIENSLELNPTGDKYVARKRFSKFTNLPELMAIYRITTDIAMTEDLDLPVPEEEKIAVKSELTDAQKEYLNLLVERSDKIKSRSVDPTEDNMLKITSEARKLALDMRLLNEKKYTLSDNNKMLQVVDRVEAIYHREQAHRGTQMIFTDLGTPRPNQFSIYQELKDLLVERGIPEEEIAFIHDANTKKAKLQLSRQMNAGEIRVLIASTEKGGTGLNVQRRLKAVHHLDVPWKPSDIIQRNGRIVRQGNIYKKVQVFHYITTGSFDNYLWQIQETKLKYITQIMTSRNPVRAAEDIDEQTMTASDFKAIATGNPYLKLKMELDNEYELLVNRRKAWERSYHDSVRRMDNAKQNLKLIDIRLERIREDKVTAKANRLEPVLDEDGKVVNDGFEMTFSNGKTFTKRDAAGNQLHFDMQMNVSPERKFVTLATYRGFALKMQTMEKPYKMGTILKLSIVGANSYPIKVDFASPLGTIQKINNVIAGLTKKEQSMLEDKENYQIVLKRGLVDDTFSDQARLDYVEAKRAVICPLVENEESTTNQIEEAIAEFEKNYEGEIVAQETVTSVERYSENYDESESEVVEEIEEVKEETTKVGNVGDNTLEFTALIEEFLTEANEFLKQANNLFDDVLSKTFLETEVKITSPYIEQTTSVYEEVSLFDFIA